MKQNADLRIACTTYNIEREVQADIKLRRQREDIFGQDLAGNPAWDILLQLYAAELAYRSVRYGQLASATTCPMSTHYRWYKALEARALVTAPDRADMIRLTDAGLRMMNELYESQREDLRG